MSYFMDGGIYVDITNYDSGRNPDVNSQGQIDDEGEYDGESPRLEDNAPLSYGGFWDEAG